MLTHVLCSVIELHNQTIISYLGLFISISGWFVWNIFLAVVYKAIPGPYIVRHSFLKNFGRNYMWWTTGILALVAVIVLEIGVAAIRRIVAPTDQDIMQVVEHYDGVMKVMHEHAAGEGGGGGGGGGGSSGAMVASGAMEEGESMPGGVVGKIAVAAAESYEPATTTINGPRHSASLIRKAGRKSLDDCLSPGVPSVAVRTSSDVPPTPARASFDMPPTPTRRPSRHLDRDDHYVPRPFTPPVEEEREDVDPRIGAVVVGGVGGRWAATSSVPGKGLGSRRKAPVPPPVVSSSESASVYGPSDHVLDASAFTASPAELSLRTSGIPLSPASRRPEAGGT